MTASTKLSRFSSILQNFNQHAHLSHQPTLTRGFSTKINDHPNLIFTRSSKARVATITLNSPQTYNALTVSIGHQFESLISSLQNQLHSNEISFNCLIITGAGKAFSSGGDITWLRNLRHNPTHMNANHMIHFYKSFLCMRELPVPIIAAINGPAIGAGACLALAADMIVMSKQSRIGFPFSKLGIHAGMGGSHFLPLRMGHGSRMMEVLLNGEILESDEAKECGLCGKVVDDALIEATKMAEEIAGRNPLSVRGMVRTLRMREEEGLERALMREADQQALCYAKGDWGEGIMALLEKREAEFMDYHEK